MQLLEVTEPTKPTSQSLGFQTRRPTFRCSTTLPTPLPRCPPRPRGPQTNLPPPIDPVTPVTAPGYVAPLLEMGFSEQQVDRARRKLKLNSNESIANQSELFKVAEVVPL